MSVGTSQPADAPTRVAVVLAVLISGYGLAGAGSFAGQCVLDAALQAHAPARWLAYAAGLGATAGALSGCALALALILLQLLDGRVRRAVVLAIGLGLAAYMLRRLGIVERLSGRYYLLAWAAVSCVVLLCSSFALLALALVPCGLGSQEAAQASWLRRAARSPRRTVLALLLLGAAGAWLADLSLWVDEYAFFHELLRKTARIGCSVALAQATLRLGARVRATLCGALGLCSLLALVALSSDRSGALLGLRKAALVGLALGELREMGDLDADGYSAWLGGGDCAPFDPRIHPGARELPGNGLDDNCHLGDLAVEPAPASEEKPLRAKQDAPSLVLITIDTLRADHVGMYGYARATTPHIDAFFASGTRFADAIAPGDYTTISMPALMRGMYARHLAWRVALQTTRFRLLPLLPGAQAQPLQAGEAAMNTHLIAHDRGRPALAQRLQAVGYHTAAVVDDGGSSFLNQAIMGEGFEQYFAVSEESEVLWDPLGDARVADHALTLLRAHDPHSAQPFLLWLHFYGAHAPDAKHADVASFGDSAIDRYDHEIASLDRQLGRVFDALSTLQLARPVVVLLTADHGESFHVFGRAHGVALNDDELKVPLLVRGPGFGRTTVRESVSLVDVVPTLMTLATERAPQGLDGVSLLPQPGAAELRAAPRAVLADVWRYDARGRIESEHVAAVAGAYRVEWDLREDTLLAYRRPGQSAQFPAPSALETAVYRYMESAGAQPDTLLE